MIRVGVVLGDARWCWAVLLMAVRGAVVLGVAWGRCCVLVVQLDQSF